MFAGRTFLLTGVGREGQVGEAVASTLAARGARVLLVDRSDDSAARAANLGQKGLEAFSFRCDLTSAKEVADLAARLRDEFGSLDALVHMAGGFAMSGSVAESDSTVWDRMFAVNLTSAYLTARAVIPLLRPTQGSIVFFASEAVLANSSAARMSAYAAAKSGVVALMRAIAQEEAVHGVRANALAPAAIRTATNVAAMGADARYVEREDVAEAVAYLCSAGASAVSGQLIRLG